MGETAHRPPDDHEVVWRRTFRIILALFGLALLALLSLLVVLAMWWNALRAPGDGGRLARPLPTAPPPRIVERQPPARSPTRVPRLVGLSLARAQSIARSSGFRLLYRRAPDRRPRGSVIAQQPREGATRQGPHPAIRVTLSNGPPPLRLPNLVGERLPRARAMAQAKGLTLIVQGTIPSTLPSGAVAHQKPAPGALIRSPGGQIRVRLSARPPRTVARSPRLLSRPDRGGPSRVPALIGLTVRQARARARAGGYWLVFHGMVRHPARRGTVVWQDPPAGAPAAGARFLGYRMSNGWSG